MTLEAWRVKKVSMQGLRVRLKRLNTDLIMNLNFYSFNFCVASIHCTMMVCAKIRNFLSFFNLFRFCRYCSEIDQRTENGTKEKHDGTIKLLRSKCFGDMLSDKENIF